MHNSFSVKKNIFVSGTGLGLALGLRLGLRLGLVPSSDSRARLRKVTRTGSRALASAF